MPAYLRRVLYGTDEPVPQPLPLRAGPLALELRGVHLLALHAHGHAVWHGVAFLYRDTGWGTPEPVVQSLEYSPCADGFHVRIRAYVPAEPPIALRVDIDGDAAGRVRYAATAVPRGDIQTHRAGLCVTHPASLGGNAVEVEHTDGRRSLSTFPVRISPWPPFMLVRGIRHSYAPGAWAGCRFEGDVFEFEEQRNNGDDSFKTYSRSNLMPRPYLLRQGVAITQAVELWLEQTAAAVPAAPSPPLSLTIGATAAPMPVLGLGLAPEDAVRPDVVEPALRRLMPPLLHLALAFPGVPVDWLGVARCLSAAGARLRLDVAGIDPGRADDELMLLAQQVRSAGIAPESLAVFPGPQRHVDAARRAFPQAKIGNGTQHFFVQLQRAEDLGGADFLSFTTAATVHCASDDAVMSGLQSLPAMVETLRARWPRAHVRIGPSGIAARDSPLGAQPASDGSRRVALARRDPRTLGLFGAAWAVAYFIQLAGAGMQAVTLMSLRGDSGVLAEGGVPSCHPVFWALQRLAVLRGAHVRQVTVSQPGRVAALATDRGELLIANLGSDTLQVAIPWGGSRRPGQVMDPQAWLAYTGGSTTEPWRAFDVQGVARLESFAVASL